MGRSRNARLAARMADLGLTREGLAQDVNRVVAASDHPGLSGVATERWVYRLLSGGTLWPRAHYRAALEQIFDCSVLDLGFVPPHGYRGPRHSRRPVDAEADMDRRRFLYIATSLGAAAITLPDVATSGRVGMADLERLAAPLEQLIALDQRRGAANLTAAATTVAAVVEETLDRATMSDRVRRCAYALQGEYLTSAGWFALDADDMVASGRYLDRALTVAAMARDPLLQAHNWNLLAYRASEAGKWGEILPIAQAGMAGTGARREPRVAAIMHGWAAEGYAAQGLQGYSSRAVGRAHDALDKITQPPVAPWLGYVDHAEIDAFGSNAARSLGRYETADELARRAIAGAPAAHGRNRASRELMLAQARLGLREVEAAVDAASFPLSQMPTMRSGRLRRRMHALRGEFGQWGEVPAARDWVAQFDVAQFDAGVSA